MKKLMFDYEQPEVEIVEIAIEKGFAASPEEGFDPELGNPDMGEG